MKPGVWGSGLDTLLVGVTASDQGVARRPAFPVAAIEKEMAVLGKSLVFGEEEIDDLRRDPIRQSPRVPAA